MSVLIYCAQCKQYLSRRHAHCPRCQTALDACGLFRVNVTTPSSKRLTRVVHGSLEDALHLERQLRAGVPLPPKDAVVGFSTAVSDHAALLTYLLGQESPVDILILDARGYIRSASGGVCARWKHIHGNLSGLHITQLIPEVALQLETILSAAVTLDRPLNSLCSLDMRIHVVSLPGPYGHEFALILQDHNIRVHDGLPVSAYGILQNAPVGIFQISLEGHFLFANPYMASIFGYDSPDDLFANLHDVGQQHYKSLRHRNAMLLRLEHNKGGINVEYTFLRRDGKPVHTRFSSRAVCDGVGRTCYYEGFITDISEQTQALKLAHQSSAERQMELELLFNTISDGIIVVDRQQYIVKINPAMRHICPMQGDFTQGFALENLHKSCSTGCFLGITSTPDMKCSMTHQIVCTLDSRKSRTLSVSTSFFMESQVSSTAAVLVIRQIPDDERRLLPVSFPPSDKRIVGTSPALGEINTMVRRLSNVDSTVLIMGESGSGKELLAEMLHGSSPRAGQVLQKINCAALSETLLESDLFGHIKGAFTGAAEHKAGRLQLANRGTVLLDEIGDISSATQLKLLRFLDTHEYQQVGDPHTYTADVRIIACTNADLSQKILKGTFREDLYYRLKVITLRMPPLRDIREDIPALVEYFLRQICQRMKKDIKIVSRQGMALLCAHSWPGNVRELKNTLEYACVMCQDRKIMASHLPPELNGGARPRL